MSARTRPIGLGIIGSGRIGTLRGRLAAGHPAVSSVTVSDLDPANAQKLAALVGGRSHGDDNLAVIEDPEVTAVIVSTSEGEHLAPMLAAIERGKPVLVEKPIALTVREADQVLAALKRSGGNMRVGYSRRYKERYQIAKEQVVKGRLGVLTYDDGAVVNLGVSYALPEKYPALGHAARVELLGTGGVVILDDDHTDQLMYSESGVPHVYLPDHVVNMVFLQSGTPGDWALGEFWGPIANETRAWLDHLATGRPCVLATPQDARDTLEVTLAIEHSMRIGMPVTLPLRAG
jgi:predicted dehydrogenase